MRPLIGVTAYMELNQSRYMVSRANMQSIYEAGGMPVLLPYVTDEQELKQIVNRVDGLYLTGGDDIDPTLFGEEPHPKLGTIIPERDRAEVVLTKKMLEKDKPILAVCRGSQILNIAAGGDMYQDIYTQIDKPLLQHAQYAPREHGSHFVYVTKGSLLHGISEQEVFRINSIHHQANRNVPSTYRVSGKASDGIIEALESRSHRFVLGLQWHPESMAVAGDVISKKVYSQFVEACGDSLYYRY